MNGFIQKSWKDGYIVDFKFQLDDEIVNILDLIFLPKDEVLEKIKSQKASLVKMKEEQSFGHLSNQIYKDNERLLNIIEKVIEFRDIHLPLLTDAEIDNNNFETDLNILKQILISNKIAENYRNSGAKIGIPNFLANKIKN